MIDLLLSLNKLEAQFTNNKFENKFTILNSINGLSNDFVNQSAKDKKGNIWIGTQNGLNRYDGVHLKTYYHNPNDTLNSICGNFITAVFVDSKDRVWIGTLEKGINIIQNNKIKSFRPNVDKSNSLKPYTYITNFYEDSKNQIWICTWGSGLYKFVENKNGFIQYSHDDKDPSSVFCNKIKCILEDSSGRFWVGIWAESPIDSLGLQIFNPSNGKFSNYYHHLISNKNPSNEHAIKTALKYIHCLSYDAYNNTLWAGGFMGLLKINLNDTSIQTYFNHNDKKSKITRSTTIRHININKSKDVIIGTQEEGIIIFPSDGSKSVFISNDLNSETSLSSNSIKQILIDSEGQWFISTSGGGLQIQIPNYNEYTFNNVKNISLDSYLKLNTINGVYSTTSQFFFFADEGLFYYNKKNQKFEKYSLICNHIENIKRIIPSNLDSSLYIVSYEQLYKLNFSTNSCLKYSYIDDSTNNTFGDVFEVLEWNLDTLILTGEFSGVQFLNTKVNAFFRINRSDENLGFWQFARKLDDSHLLIGYANGLLKYNVYKKTLTHCFLDSIPRKLISGWASHQTVSSNDSTFWFVCDSSLGMYNTKSNSYKFYPLIQNHLLIPFYNIQKDSKGNLWLIGEYDIYHFSVHNQQYTRIQSRLIKSNFPNYKFSFIDTTTGKLYCSGPVGLKTIDTRLFYNNEYLNPIHINEIMVNGNYYENDFQNGKRISLPYNKNNLSISFSNYDYKKNKFYTIEYKLDPLQTDWITAPTNQIIELNNLKPGKYKLQLRYKNIENENLNSELLLINIDKPFWQTIWFGALIIALLGITIKGITKYQVKILEKQNLELEKKINDRTLELQNQKKKSEDLLLNILPQNIVDELKTKGYSEAKVHENVSVLFSDFVNFSGICAQLEPKVVVEELDKCFKHFDSIVEKFGLEKIKTIGDSYMAVGGLHNSSIDQTRNTVRAAEEFIQYIEESNCIFRIRIGIHTGPVIAGVVGLKKFAYDIWGDTVNIASRMESSGIPNRINLSKDTFDQISADYICESRGMIDTKNTGELEMFLLQHPRKDD